MYKEVIFLFLKKVEIQGFKSFADKIEIEFEKGVTGIVGPNGSGKSNVSDAVRWVLGEQSPKTLRGSKMEDIIFAGTTQRKPVGMAEVSLTLDNAENRLPIDFSEVTVTRRVYRSGESEYYLNRSLCRLKDIREVFMDTGVGIDGYSIIGQGRIDEILSNKGEERRLIFEEAAGIVKYKTRKTEAEKKLENTNHNLTRVDDIVDELETRIGPLEKQSEKAKRYIKIREELKLLEINLIVHELESLKYKIDELKEQEEIIDRQLQDDINNKKELENEYKSVKLQIEELDQSISQMQDQLYSIKHTLEKKDGEIGLCNEKIKHIFNDMDRLNQEIHGIDTNNEMLEVQLNTMKSELGDKSEAYNDLKEQLNNKMNIFNELNQSQIYQEEKIEKSKSQVIELMNEIATKKSEINSIMSLMSSIQKRTAQIENDKLDLLEKRTQLSSTKEDITLNGEKIQKELNDHINHKKELHRKFNETQNHFDQLKKEKYGIQQKMSEYQTKKKLLDEMQKDYDGYHKSVKNTLIHTKNNPVLGRGICGVVAELIHVPKEYEIAIEVALGGAMQNIVCEMADDASRIIHYLKKHNLGRVTFLPLDSIKSSPSYSGTLEKSKGFIGFASDMISFDAKYKEIFQNLLGRVILIDKIDNGIHIAKMTGFKYKIVSLDGDIINPGGAITGGSYQGKSSNLLSRKREIEELETAIQNKQMHLETCMKTLQQVEASHNRLIEEMKKIDEHVKQIEIALINNENERKQVDKEDLILEENMNKLLIEVKQLNLDQEEMNQSLNEKKKEILDLEKKQQSIQDSIVTFKSDYDTEKNTKDELSIEVTNLKVEIASIEQQKRNHELNIRNLEQKIQEQKNEAITKRKETEALSDQKKSLLDQLDLLKIEIKDSDVLRQQFEFNLSQQREKRKAIHDKYDELDIQLNRVNQKVSDLQDSRHKIEVKRARLEIQQETYCNRLWEEYEITYLEALDYKNETINLTESTKQIKTLRNEIKELGTVNVHAIEEYKEVTERYTFLKEQKEDLIQAKQSLQQVIKEMENIMKDQFIEYFELIKENFDQVFRKLFGGGKAELKLSDENEVLTSGIEIIAQPPGKKLQHLSLLSGGERALTAISLLFAILKIKPTPFCILDEIEAALDDANVYRYADFLKEFSKETQFIVVTHRKGTMEAVDALYGITMQEHGVSKLVSVKLTERAS
ncbi:MAG: chromosome segregation protein SMC [Bacillota bacterium]